MPTPPVQVRYNIKKEVLLGKTKEECRRRLGKIGGMVRTEAIKLVSKGGGSLPAPTSSIAREEYRKQHKYYYRFLERWVQGSFPGEPPRSQTSSLMTSITYKVNDSALAVLIGPSVLYAKWVEFGTKRMKARPFMRPALFNTVSSMPKIFEGML